MTQWCEQGAYVVGTEAYSLNPTLREWAFRQSESVTLVDNAQVQEYRAQFPEETARREPFVTKCDGLMTDTFWSGSSCPIGPPGGCRSRPTGRVFTVWRRLKIRARLAALKRLAASGRVDMQRVMVMRAASDFDQPPPGMTAPEALEQSLDDSIGGGSIAYENLYRGARRSMR